jgi:hypothetical protein
LFVRQVELRSQLYRVACVLKTREYGHDQRLWTFTVSSDGVHFGDQLHGADAILTGTASRADDGKAR